MLKLNNHIESLGNSLKDLLKSASTVTIKTEKSVIVLSIAGNKIVTEIYESCSLNKVGYHALSSLKELQMLFSELGLCLFEIVRRLFLIRFTKKDKPLLLELKK